MLEQDYRNLNEFAKQFPLKFQRMYGYIIGLKLDNLSNSAQQNKFMFMRYLLKNVKSRIFKVTFLCSLFALHQKTSSSSQLELILQV